MLESEPDQEFEEMISELSKEILAGLDQRLAFEVYADAWDILHPTKQ